MGVLGARRGRKRPGPVDLHERGGHDLPTNVYITVIQLLFTSDIQVADIGDMQLKIASSVVIYVLTAFTIAELDGHGRRRERR